MSTAILNSERNNKTVAAYLIAAQWEQVGELLDWTLRLIALAKGIYWIYKELPPKNSRKGIASKILRSIKSGIFFFAYSVFDLFLWSFLAERLARFPGLQKQLRTNFSVFPLLGLVIHPSIILHPLSMIARARGIMVAKTLYILKTCCDIGMAQQDYEAAFEKLRLCILRLVEDDAHIKQLSLLAEFLRSLPPKDVRRHLINPIGTLCAMMFTEDLRLNIEKGRFSKDDVSGFLHALLAVAEAKKRMQRAAKGSVIRGDSPNRAEMGTASSDFA